jgi:hypothetical protein
MAKMLDRPSLYDMDYVDWLGEQAAHLRAGRLDQLDLLNIAEQLESLLSTERRELENRLDVLILHLLKWDHQPEQRSNRWCATIQNHRTRIRRLLRDSPSLRREVEPMARSVYADAVEGAAIETLLSPSVFPPDLPYAVEEILERELPAEELPDHRPT